MLNLNTTFPVWPHATQPGALPVLVDLNWLGRTLTSPNGGIVNNGHTRPEPKVVL